MASKQVGLASVVKTNSAGNSFTTLTLVSEFTPPTRRRVRVNAVALEDTLATDELGIEDVSDFEFTQFWHVGDTNHELVDTLFGNKAEAGWQWISPHSTPKTCQFNGKVVAMDPQPVQHNTLFMRKVTVMRTGAITVT